MKTRHMSRSAYIHASYIFVFLWTAFSVNAQCPTISNPTPLPICDASNFTFADLNTFATDGGNGIVWYNMATGGSAFSASQLVAEGTYYADDNSGTCGTRASIVVDFQVDASGQNLDSIYCSNDNPTVQTYIDDVLQSIIPVGGSVLVYNDIDLTSPANGTDAIPTGANNYFVVFIDAGGCKSQIEIGSTAMFNAPPPPNPTEPQEFCSNTNPTVGNLDPGTTDTFAWYDNIDGFGNPILPSLSSATPLVNGNTYYVQVTDIFCDSDPVPVTVGIDDPANPGTPGILEYCEDSIPTTDFNLFDELGGTPETTGLWTGPLSTANGHLGTVNISTLTTPGTYTFTYTIVSNGACPDDVSSVTITIYETFTSGVPSANNPTTFCQIDLPSAFDLTTLLDGEDPNGQWTQGTLSTDPIVASPIDLSGFTPGTYNFTYTQNVMPNPCPEESTTVQVVVLQDPEAGIAVNQTFCENDLTTNSPFDLFIALDGSQDNNGGNWTDASGTTVTTPIDITGLTVTGSPYQYTYTISNGTCDDMETIIIDVLPAPESGNALAPVEICEEDLLANSPFDLFTLLDGTQDTNGTWADASMATVVNPIDISGFTAGTYDFTYSVPDIGTCSDVDVLVQIIVNPNPNTGTPTVAVFCENDLVGNSPLNLFGQIAGEDAGGTWTDDDATGALTVSNVDLTLLTIGSYNFTYSITANGCANSSTVAVTIEAAPESGTINPPTEFCLGEVTTGQTYDLFDLLEGEDQTGTWSDDDTSGALSGNTVTLDGLTQGTYNFTFDVDAIGSCDDVDNTVSIIINDTPVPTVTAMQSFCDSATVADLSATGTAIQWYNDATGGTALDASTVLVNGENYYTSQTDATSGCESSTRTEVVVTINTTPNSGNLATTAIFDCNTNNSIDLSTGLDGTQDVAGTWMDDDATGALTGMFLDATGLIAGTYNFTYVVTAIAPCLDASTTITVTIDEPLNAGTDAVLDVCSDNGTTDLFSLIGPADAGGIWLLNGNTVSNILDAATAESGTYTYLISNACGNSSSDVVVTITQAPNAGTDNATTLCVIDGTVDLFTLLGTADTTGTWSPALPSGSGVFDPASDTAGVYTYTVLATSPCTTNASAQITVTVNDTPTPVVTNATPSFCLVDNPTVADLDGFISSAGTITWYTDATQTTVLASTETLEGGEDYFATQTNGSGCESSTSATVTVTVNNIATPTLIDSNLELCISDGPILSELTNNITEYNASANNVVWYDAATDGNAISGNTALQALTTYYAVLVDATTGCESSVRLAVAPNLTGCGVLAIPDGFSPNGDGTNDTFDIDNLNILFPNFELEIYNRYGNIVYKGNASTPSFDGTSNQPKSLGNGELPVGVYYYIFNYNDGVNKPKQGSLYLNR